ncbi:hypothetical protein E3N88_33395 [Mikania micrantha]|uniref:Phospholipase A1 n=1 Tax=Mikania micrantha TaxID=192012 RepID=A0A5N6MBC8_9ASTR|nr:hypothetical protein E3N88_33395 [Mikania micrantha]
MDHDDYIAKNWRKLNGEDHWKESLDPPSPHLRTYINHYGEMAEATYDAYIQTSHSKNAGNCKYARTNLLKQCGLLQGRPLNQYKVTKYLYAMSAVTLPGAFVFSSDTSPWSKKSNWMGFIAVATDDGKKVLGRRDILVAWRGTVNPSDMIYDSELNLVSAPIVFGSQYKDDDPKIHQGWYSIYTTSDQNSRYNKSSARDQHGCGGCDANAIDIVLNGLNKQSYIPAKSCPVTMWFQNSHPWVLGRRDRASDRHAQVSVLEGTREPMESGQLHMESYMHGVAGVQTGILGGFKLEINRDLSLVNKFGDILDDKYGVPPSWWTEENMGMVQKHDGTWELKDHEEDIEP